MYFDENEKKTASEFILKEVDTEKIMELYRRLDKLYKIINFNNHLGLQTENEQQEMWNSLESILINSEKVDGELSIKTPTTTTTLTTNDTCDMRSEKKESITFDGTVLTLTETINSMNQNNIGKPHVLAEKTHSFDGEKIRVLSSTNYTENDFSYEHDKERVVYQPYSKFRDLNLDKLNIKMKNAKYSLEKVKRSKNYSSVITSLWGFNTIMNILPLITSSLNGTSRVLKLTSASMFGIVTLLKGWTLYDESKKQKEIEVEIEEIQDEKEIAKRKQLSI